MAERAWVGPAWDPHRYVLGTPLRPVGAGGQAFVYRGERCSDGEPVAVKQLTGITREDWEVLRRRARLVRDLTHPGLERILDDFTGPHPFSGPVPAGEEFDTGYLVAAWVDGEDLTRAVAGAPIDEALGWVRDVGHAVHALHTHPTLGGLGIVHRDVKPSNVRVGGGRAVLIDLGVARPLDGATITAGVGSPGWHPPEAWREPDRVGPGSDTWQVAGLAWWVLVRSPPGRREPSTSRARLRQGAEQAGVARPGRLARHIDAGLAERIEQRPADIAAWCDELAGLARRRAGAARVERARRPLVAAPAALALAGVLAAGAALVRGRGPEAPAVPGGAGVAIEHVEVDPGAHTGLVYREPVTVRVRISSGLDPAPLRVRVEPLAGPPRGRGDVAPIPPAEAPAQAGGTASVTFTVDGDAGAVPVSAVRITVLAAGRGEPVGSHVEPVHIAFGTAVPGPERCVAYDPAALRVEPVDQGWGLVDGHVQVAVLPDREDARRALALAAGADRSCVIGPHPAVGAGQSTTHYWKRGDRLVMPAGPVAAGEDCQAYDPAAVAVDLTEAGANLVAGEGQPLLVLRDPADAERAATVARSYSLQCFIGRIGAPADASRRFDYWRP